jgi:tetratricopeptide (TPR) repeat protein
MTVVAMSGSDGRFETPARVKAFVDGETGLGAVRVAFDDVAKTREAYLSAARMPGIPAAFLVDGEGKIAWMGNPVTGREGLERVVKELMAGTFDRGAAVAAAKAAEAARGEREAKAAGLQVELREALAAGKHAEAVQKIDELVRLDGERFVGLAVARFETVYLGKRDADAAFAYARGLLEGPTRDEARVLDAVAWRILDSATAPRRDLDLAVALSRRAVEVSRREDAPMLDTLARGLFERGDVAEAVEVQARAVEVAPAFGGGEGDGLKARLQETLERYRKELEEERRREGGGAR